MSKYLPTTGGHKGPAFIVPQTRLPRIHTTPAPTRVRAPPKKTYTCKTERVPSSSDTGSAATGPGARLSEEYQGLARDLYFRSSARRTFAIQPGAPLLQWRVLPSVSCSFSLLTSRVLEIVCWWQEKCNTN